MRLSPNLTGKDRNGIGKKSIKNKQTKKQQIKTPKKTRTAEWQE